MKQIAIAGALAVGLLSSGAALAADAKGNWISSDGDVTVRVANCGGKLCGKIVAMEKPNRNGKPKTDIHNPDESLRDRPLIGLTVLRSMAADGDNKWKGTIYNADDGKTYSAYMSLSGSTMKVKGCVAVFCSTKTFKKLN